MACSDYADGEWINALDAGVMGVRDAVLCPYTDSMGTMVFATLVMVGMVNVPIYIRQESLIVPFGLTLTLGGIWVTAASSLAQTLTGVVLLFVVGLGPVLILWRLTR
jgi:hypothetical protein